MSQTLAIIKPDAVRRGRTGRIIAHLESSGFTIRAARMMTMTRAQAESFYDVHRERPFYDSLVAFMTSGPCIPIVLRGVRTRCPGCARSSAPPIRPRRIRARCARFTRSPKERNAIHGSDSAENARREIGFFFPECDRLG